MSAPVPCDLKRLYGNLARGIPSNVWEGETTRFSAENLPSPPARLETNRLIITKGYSGYLNYFRADMVIFQARAPVYRELALLILAIVFKSDWDPTELPMDPVQLVLTHPKSEVRKILISSTQDLEGGVGLISTPVAYIYRPKEVQDYSQRSLPESRFDLPRFLLSGEEDDLMVTTQEWERRANLMGFGNARANTLFADVLLDVGRPDGELSEIEIGHAMNNTIAPLSAEARLWLPGHYYWDDHLFPRE